MDQPTTSLAERPVIRTRRKRVSNPKRKGLRVWLRGEKFGRLLVLAMGVTAVANVAFVALETRNASTQLGDVQIGMAQAELRSALGNPTSTQPDGTWIYRNGGEVIEVKFDAQGRLISTSCAEAPNSLELCPRTLGLRVGTLKRELVLRLGSPEQTTSERGSKILHYPGLGLSFRLANDAVDQIRLSEAKGGLSLVKDAAWLMLP